MMSVNSSLKSHLDYRSRESILQEENSRVYQNNEQAFLEKKEVEPVEPVLKNIYQSSTYRKDLSWSHLDNEPRAQEKQQVMDQQSCKLVFVACIPIPSSNQEHQPRRDNDIPYMGVRQIIEIQSNLRRKKLHRTN